MNLGLLALTMSLAPAMPMEPVVMPSAFTFVKVIGPEGSKTTWYPQTSLAAATRMGTPVGLRPGYSYRFEMANVGLRNNQTIWPSIEVRGSLVPKPNMNPADHPVPIFMTEEDVERILEGRFVTKIYYLEDPDKAVNGPQDLGIPLENSVPNEMDAMKNARANGRLMIIVRAGERLWDKDELQTQNVPGTIWIPSQMKAFPMPVAPPTLPFVGVAYFDPLIGPKQLTGECLHDGGDRFANLGIGRENKLYGLDPSDTSLEFGIGKGKQVVTSNRVCICIPRFAVQRVEVAAILQHGFAGPQIGLHIDRQLAVVHKLPSLNVKTIEQPINAVGGTRASGLILETGPRIQELFIGKPEIVANMKGAKIVGQMREPGDITTYSDCCLILNKRMDPPNPKQIGDIVTFYLSYRNPGAEPMTDLVVSDSLTGRLEYIPNTAKSDRAATFTATPNEAGSLTLRWAIDDKLLPGQRGVVAFQARIR